MSLQCPATGITCGCATAIQGRLGRLSATWLDGAWVRYHVVPRDCLGLLWRAAPLCARATLPANDAEQPA